MNNINPINLDKRPDKPTEYIIPAEERNTMIYVTVKIELDSKKWQYAAAHNVLYRGNDIFPNKIPEPVDLKIDRAKDADQHKLFLSSHVSRFRDGADDDTPAIVKYTLTIEAGDKLLDTFEKEGNVNNPSNFFSLIIFKLGS